MMSAVDDPVAFYVSAEVQAAVRDLVVELSGYPFSTNLVEVIITLVTRKDIDTEGGGRRLLGLVTIDFSIMVPADILKATLTNFATSDRSHASSFLASRISVRGRPDLTSNIYVQEISAMERPSTTATMTPAIVACPPTQLCFSDSCGSCSNWRSNDLECQETKVEGMVNECICSCFRFTGNMTTPPPFGLTSSARSSILHVSSLSVALVMAWVPLVRSCL